MTLTSANPHQPHIQTNTQTSSGMQPPISRDPSLTKLKAANFNKAYLIAHNLAPRRPAYSTSRVEVNRKSSQNQQQELMFEPSNSFFMKLEQPIRTQVQGNARLSDQTRPRTGNYIKNCHSNLVRASHYSSSESIQPCQTIGNAYNGSQRQSSNKIKQIKFLQETQIEDNILNRKSAFQPVNSVSQTQKQTLGEAAADDSPYIVQQTQIVVSPSPGTSSTTSSISSSMTATSSSHCMSNSNSANSSLSYHSKSTDNILHGAAKNNIVKLITSDSKQQQSADGEATKIKSFIGISNRPNTENIRSGSVSSARSIYELRLKSLNENNMPQGFVPRSAHSYRLGSTGSANQVPVNPALKYQSVKLEKQPRRRTHLSDNDFLEAFSSKQPNIKFQPPQTPDFSDKNLNKYLKTNSAGPRHSLTNEAGEQQQMLLAAQRRLSYHNHKAAFNDIQKPSQLKYPSHCRSVCVENGVEVGDNTEGLVLDLEDGCGVDLEYGDDDIFADEEEEIVLQSKYINPTQSECPKPNSFSNQISPGTSSSSACSSSSIVSTSSDGCNQLPTKTNSNSNGTQYTSESLSSGKSMLSSASSGSMNTSIHGKPPHVPSTPKSPKSYDSKQGNIFNFNNIPQGNLVQNNITKEFSLESSLAPPPMPPPLPSQSTQLNNNSTNSQVEFLIPDQLQPFAHFDLQSSFFNFERVKLIKEVLNLSINMRTGASAASKQQAAKSQETAADTNKSIPLRVTNNKAPTSNLKYRSGIQSISSILGSLEQQSSVDSENIAGDLLKGENEWMERTGTIDRLRDKNETKTRLSSSVFMHLNDDRTSIGDFNSLKKNKALSVNTDNHNLVEDCSFFRLELGGDVFKGLGLFGDLSQRRMMALNSVNILDRSV